MTITSSCLVINIASNLKTCIRVYLKVVIVHKIYMMLLACLFYLVKKHFFIYIRVCRQFPLSTLPALHPPCHLCFASSLYVAAPTLVASCACDKVFSHSVIPALDESH
jgi:hypothetical protein